MLERLKGARRRAVAPSGAGLVRASSLAPEASLPLVVEPAMKGVEPAAWAAVNRDWVEERLLRHGGLLFRGFAIDGPDAFRRFVAAAVGEELLPYSERSSPREAVGVNVYTSTDYPAVHSIFLHNENSYQQSWPMRIAFYCAAPAREGGATPIADCRKVYERISPPTRERFQQRGWMYVRNFGDGFGLPWQIVFQTEDRGAVEEHCRHNGIRVEWRSGNRLRVSAVRRAAATHPQTGEAVWFNHATFFHVSTLEAPVRDALLHDFGGDELPTNTFYGDGSPIEPETLKELREAYRAETVAFPWQAGDVLLLDNMLVAHGREPFVGDRRILVAMARLHRAANV